MMMGRWSQVAWVLHDLGLAIAVGGTLFGKLALHPAARRMQNAQERDELIGEAWSRFQALSLASHAAVAGTWLIGRTMLSGREAVRWSRPLVIAKDVLVGAGLASVVATAILGRVLGGRIAEHAGPAQESGGWQSAPGDGRSRWLERVVGAVGSANLAADAGVMGLTSLLAVQAGRSGRFALRSYFLP